GGAAPGVRLEVFSDVGASLMAPAEDEKQHGALYRLARETEGVECVGSIAQPQLARAMAEVSVWSYPNTFAETWCIAAMEAMAAGCRVVTSDRGALAETTAGFARLVPSDLDEPEFERRFVQETIAAIEELD